MTPPIRAVLDANVLVPIALCDLLIRTSEEGLYRACWSETILTEVERTLVGDVHIAPSAAHRRVAAMRAVQGVMTVTGYEALIATMPNEPGDRHVLAAAIHAGAPIIVTRNLRHFPAAALAPYGVVVQSADRFLLDRLAAAPEAMADTVRAQAAALLRPPQSVEQVLVRLDAEVPHFARALAVAVSNTG